MTIGSAKSDALRRNTRMRSELHVNEGLRRVEGAVQCDHDNYRVITRPAHYHRRGLQNASKVESNVGPFDSHHNDNGDNRDEELLLVVSKGRNRLRQNRGLERTTRELPEARAQVRYNIGGNMEILRAKKYERKSYERKGHKHADGARQSIIDALRLSFAHQHAPRESKPVQAAPDDIGPGCAMPETTQRERHHDGDHDADLAPVA